MTWTMQLQALTFFALVPRYKSFYILNACPGFNGAGARLTEVTRPWQFEDKIVIYSNTCDLTHFQCIASTMHQNLDYNDLSSATT